MKTSNPATSDQAASALGGYFLRRLMAAAVIVAVPLLALQAYLLLRQAQWEKQAAINAIVASSHDAANDVDATLARAERLLDFLTSREELQKLDATRCGQLVQGLTKVDPALVNVGAVDMEGNPICLSVVSASRFKSYKDVPWFREGLGREDEFLSKPFIGDITHRAIVNLVRPLRDAQGKRIGMVGAALDLGAIAEGALSVEGLPEASVVSLLTADHVILARNPDTLHWIGRSIPPATREETDDAKPAVFFNSSVDGIPRLYARTPLKHFGLSVGAGVPRDAITANSRAQLVRSAAATALVALLGFLAATIAARRLNAPLQSLGRTARTLAAGNAEVRADETLPGEFAQVAAEFNRAIAARNALDAIEQSRHEAQAASEAKSQFLAHISHEIRTPMNAILGLVQLTLRTRLDAKQRDYLTKTKASADALLALLNDVLDLSKIEAGKLNLEEREFQIRHLIAQVTTIAAPRAEAKGLRFSTSVETRIPHALRGDGARLCQVLVNLTSNAVKFTKIGAVDLSVSMLDHSAGTVNLRFSVKDTGIGMTEGQAERLFKPFMQADASTTREYGGTGLGLSICDQLVRAMGGKLSFESAPGAGSTFVVDVRLKEAGHDQDGPVEPVSAPSLPAAQYLAQLAGRHLLLVEDNELNQLVATELLTFFGGAKVDICSNGADALVAVEAKSYDAILMDIQMPGIDGYETTRRLRAEPSSAAIPIIAVTANATSRDRARCFEAGMQDFIAKPFEPDVLFKTLAAHMKPREGDAAQDMKVEPIPPGVSFDSGLAQCLGKPELYERILGRFLELRANLPQQVAGALFQGERDKGASLLHALISTAATVGAARLSSLARDFAKSIAEGREEDWPGYSSELAREHALVTEQIGRRLHRPTAN